MCSVGISAVAVSEFGGKWRDRHLRVAIIVGPRNKFKAAIGHQSAVSIVTPLPGDAADRICK
jgi:hypothetical protein